jgi:hypothetical protein
VIDTPNSDHDTETSGGNLEGATAIPASTEGAEPHESQENSEQHSHPAEDVMRTLKAIGNGLRNTVNWIDAKGPFITAASTVVIAVLTGFYVHYSRGQWVAMRESNKINKEALESVQRANVVFVTVHDQRGDAPTPAGKTELIWQFTPLWENVGNTAAATVIQAFFAKSQAVEPDEQQFMGPSEDYTPFQIGPRSRQQGSTVTLPQAVVMAARSDLPVGPNGPPVDVRKNYSWGWLIYRDVFPDTKPHITEFCLHLIQAETNLPQKTFGGFARIPIAPPPNLQVFLTWEGCKAHNCADQYCKDYNSIMAKFLPKE